MVGSGFKLIIAPFSLIRGLVLAAMLLAGAIYTHPARACAACYLTPDQLNQSFTQENPAAEPAPPPVQAPVQVPARAPDNLYDWLAFQLDQVQRDTGQRISLELNRLKSREGAGGLIWALAMGFAYGAFHALGPGHGKVLVLSYFVGKNARPRDGMIMGAQIAVFHVLSAIIAVGATEILTRLASGAAPADYHWLRQISYGLIAVCGAYMTMQALRRQPDACAQCDHDRHHHHGHTHAHDQSHNRQRLTLSAAIGSVPCTGAILVLAFALANDLVVEGIAIVAAISAGMALTLAAMGLIAIYSSNKVQQRIAAPDARHWLVTCLRAIGGGVITLFGLGLMVTAA
jgi:ABC-type nickel/cobalt efflux system permease component RcnA